jgi:hypothetical protein
VLITRNSRDFAPIAREWAEARRSHAGLILIWTLDHSQFARSSPVSNASSAVGRPKSNGAT